MINILQTPNEINAAYGINAITLTGITIVQRRYRLEIWNDDETALYASLIITPNAYGNGVADIQNVLQTLIQPSPYNIEKIVSINNSFYETKQYIIKAVEVDLNDEPIDEDEYVSEGPYLTIGARKDPWSVNFTVPTKALSDYDYTINADSILYKPTIGNGVKIKLVSINENDYYTLSYKNTFTSYTIYPYADDVALTTITITNSLTAVYPNIFITLPVGPLNLGGQLPNNTTKYFVKVNSDWWLFTINDECDTFNPIQLSWQNSYGFRDYYTFRKRDDKRTTVSRNTFNKSIIDYNDVAVMTTRGEGGQTIYSQKIETEYTIRTDYLDDKESLFFENLIMSANVRAKINGVWYNILLTRNEWRIQRYITDKMFQFEVSFKIAANQKSQRG